MSNYIVTDPDICHGKLTIKGTRILVKDIAEQINDGMTDLEILTEWRGGLSSEALKEVKQYESKTSTQ